MYWNTTNSNTIKVSDIGHYANFPNLTSTTNEGYNCDRLQATPVLFMGSCDMDGPINDSAQVWSRLLYSSMIKQESLFPYIALGKMTAGFMAFPRRLFTFCEKYGPPAKLFAVIPRPAAVEIPLLTGELVSVSNRKSFADYLYKHQRIGEADYKTLVTASDFYQTQINNLNYQLYQFEQSAAFLKLLCTHYKIEFKWTMNLSSSAIAYYNQYFVPFMENVPFMYESFIGTTLAKDFAFDGSMGDESQHQVHKLFVSKMTMPSFDFNDTLVLLEQNMATAIAHTSKTQRAF